MTSFGNIGGTEVTNINTVELTNDDSDGSNENTNENSNEPEVSDGSNVGDDSIMLNVENVKIFVWTLIYVNLFSCCLI